MGDFGKAALPGVLEGQRPYSHTLTAPSILEKKADQANLSVR